MALLLKGGMQIGIDAAHARFALKRKLCVFDKCTNPNFPQEPHWQLLRQCGPRQPLSYSSLRPQNVELKRYGWVHDIRGEGCGATGIERVSQNRRPLGKRQAKVSA